MTLSQPSGIFPSGFSFALFYKDWRFEHDNDKNTWDEMLDLKVTHSIQASHSTTYHLATPKIHC